MNSESERTAREPAAAWPARTFSHATDVSGIAASAVHARLHASLQSCPEVRARGVTERSPQAAFRHTDIHAPPPRDRLECSAIRVPSTQPQP
jgi:hypothetical protein